jgi:predicted nucleotidyltransferase
MTAEYRARIEEWWEGDWDVVIERTFATRSEAEAFLDYERTATAINLDRYEHDLYRYHLRIA